jgi:hypothetical protein
MVNAQAKRALLDLLADELRVGLGRAPGLDRAARCNLIGLVDDLVELAMGLETRPSLDATTAFDLVYREAQK